MIKEDEKSVFMGRLYILIVVWDISDYNKFRK